MSKDKMEYLLRGKDQSGLVPVQSFMVRCAFRYALGRMTSIVVDLFAGGGGT